MDATGQFNGTSFVSIYHNYKLVWTKASLLFMIDKTIYRNITYPPWRPMAIRPILRTSVGTARSVQQLPDANVLIRRIKCALPCCLRLSLAHA